MQKIKFDLNSNGIRELLKSAEIADYVKSTADERASGCGNGYETDSKVLSGRVVSSIFTATAEAENDNFKNNTLLKAVGR